MDIIVCIKQVPDTNDVKIDPKTNTLIREGVKSIINPFDENAIEEALRIKEKTGGKVTVITMGPTQATEALKTAIAMGADEAILISDRAFAGSDTWATSYTLSKAIKKVGKFDLVLFGKQAIDGDTAQVGPGVAEFLDIPQITFAIKIDIDGNFIKVKRQLEESVEVLKTELPAAVTVVKQINEPRLPSLKGQMRAKKAQIPIWTAADIEAEPENLGLKGSPTQVVKIFTPTPRGKSEILQGEPEDIAKKLLDVGIKGIDVAGSGGTSWAKVEMVRNNYFNNYFSNWGLPTSYCVRTVSKLKKNYKFVLISSGGINNGIDIAKSIALGADLSASARIILKELFENDIKGVINLINEWFDDVKKIMYLTGVKNLNELHKIKLIKKSELF